MRANVLLVGLVAALALVLGTGCHSGNGPAEPVKPAVAHQPPVAVPPVPASAPQAEVARAARPQEAKPEAGSPEVAMEGLLWRRCACPPPCQEGGVVFLALNATEWYHHSSVTLALQALVLLGGHRRR